MTLSRANFNHMIILVKGCSANNSVDDFVTCQKVLRYPNGRSCPFFSILGHKKYTSFGFFLIEKGCTKTKTLLLSYLLFRAPLFTNTKNTTHRCILASKYKIRL